MLFIKTQKTCDQTGKGIIANVKVVECLHNDLDSLILNLWDFFGENCGKVTVALQIIVLEFDAGL